MRAKQSRTCFCVCVCVCVYDIYQLKFFSQCCQAQTKKLTYLTQSISIINYNLIYLSYIPGFEAFLTLEMEVPKFSFPNILCVTLCPIRIETKRKEFSISRVKLETVSFSSA